MVPLGSADGVARRMRMRVTHCDAVIGRTWNVQERAGGARMSAIFFTMRAHFSYTCFAWLLDGLFSKPPEDSTSAHGSSAARGFLSGPAAVSCSPLRRRSALPKPRRLPAGPVSLLLASPGSNQAFDAIRKSFLRWHQLPFDDRLNDEARVLHPHKRHTAEFL